jgi:hypothetical protein
VKRGPGLISLTALLLSIASCAGEPALARLQWEPPPPKPPEQVLIIDHQNIAQKEMIPHWVDVYDERGIQGLESLPDYTDSYLFVAKNQGNNFEALSLWLAGFSISQDFTSLIAMRINERFTSAATSYPSDEYGAYFESVIKAAFDAEYTGAVTEATYWLLKRYFKEDGITPDRTVYEFLILARINKALLVSQVNALLDSVTPATRLTKAQTSAVALLRAAFFDQF